MLFNKFFVFILLFVFQANSNGMFKSSQNTNAHDGNVRTKLAQTIIVAMGDIGTVFDKKTCLTTEPLTASAAIVVISKKNKQTFPNRILININGCLLEGGLNDFDSDKTFAEIKASLSTSKNGKVYFISGIENSTDKQLARCINQKNTQEKKPVLDLLLSEGVELIMASALNVKVSEKGVVEISSIGRGLLTPEEKAKVFQICKDD